MNHAVLEPGNEATHESVRVAAFHERCSMGEVIRRAVAKYLTKRKGKGKP